MFNITFPLPNFKPFSSIFNFPSSCFTFKFLLFVSIEKFSLSLIIKLLEFKSMSNFFIFSWVNSILVKSSLLKLNIPYISEILMTI